MKKIEEFNDKCKLYEDDSNWYIHEERDDGLYMYKFPKDSTNNKEINNKFKGNIQTPIKSIKLPKTLEERISAIEDRLDSIDSNGRVI